MLLRFGLKTSAFKTADGRFLPGGTRRRLQYTGGKGVAPGRILPFIVPMNAGLDRLNQIGAEVFSR